MKFKSIYLAIIAISFVYTPVNASTKDNIAKIVIQNEKDFSEKETIKIFDYIKENELELLFDISAEAFLELAYQYDNLDAQSMIFDRMKSRKVNQNKFLEYIITQNIKHELSIDLINSLSKDKSNTSYLLDRNDILAKLDSEAIRNQIRYAILEKKLTFARSLVKFLPKKEEKFFEVLIENFSNIQFEFKIKDYKKYAYLDELIDLEIAQHLMKKRQYNELNDFFHDINYVVTFEKGQWEKLFNILLREFFTQNNLHEVNDLMQKINAFTTSNSTRASVYEMAGMFSLENHQYQNALEYFTEMKKHSFYAVSKAKANYFIGKSYEKLRDFDKSKLYFTKASYYPMSYYGQKSIKKLKLSLSEALKSEKLKEYTTSRSLYLTEIAIKLFENKQFKQGKYITEKTLENSNISKADKIKFIHQVSKIQPDLKYYLGRYLSRMNIYHQKSSYPIFKNIKDPFLLGIMRQETQFETGMVSYKGARGLMQIMPPTAKDLCRKHKIKYNQYLLSHDENYNLKLAKLYIDDLKKMFNGNLELTAAAYNAGPSVVKRWMRDERIKFEDPHTLEKIPYHETRNYILRVMEGTRVYEALLQEK